MAEEKGFDYYFRIMSKKIVQLVKVLGMLDNQKAQNLNNLHQVVQEHEMQIGSINEQTNNLITLYNQKLSDFREIQEKYEALKTETEEQRIQSIKEFESFRKRMLGENRIIEGDVEIGNYELNLLRIRAESIQRELQIIIQSNEMLEKEIKEKFSKRENNQPQERKLKEILEDTEGAESNPDSIGGLKEEIEKLNKKYNELLENHQIDIEQLAQNQEKEKDELINEYEEKCKQLENDLYTIEEENRKLEEENMMLKKLLEDLEPNLQ